MRRSAAPSQLQGNPFKKPKFIPPGRSNPNPNEEIVKLNSDRRLSEGDATNNTILQSQNNSRVSSLELPAGENTRKLDHGERYSGQSSLEASSMTIADVPRTESLEQGQYMSLRVVAVELWALSVLF
ncbi:DNA repair and recombination protein RAD54B-like [Sorex fumeus]|uniref:DNA repair and recombination protein RAD54B-like n=1 Tax=Sorex fumeus TaxID=62283 RepID=UPI0024AC8D52|nr:DNA repair and recombination protein RAD54B-like [Sorex fumeus]